MFSGKKMSECEANMATKAPFGKKPPTNIRKEKLIYLQVL